MPICSMSPDNSREEKERDKMKSLPKIFCAIDTPDMKQAAALAESMRNAGCGIKLGLEFFNYNGPQGIAAIRDTFNDLPIFLDLKLHDIPNTVAGAVRSVSKLNVTYLTLHAAGGREMMQAAQYAADGKMMLLAVTILTSLDGEDLEEMGFALPPQEAVVRLARITEESGLAGIVCSPKEIQPVRNSLGEDLALMVPGIRPAGSATQDQKRVMTPQEAMQAGATHLVIGRPITGADDPAAAAAEIMASLQKAAA